MEVLDLLFSYRPKNTAIIQDIWIDPNDKQFEYLAEEKSISRETEDMINSTVATEIEDIEVVYPEPEEVSKPKNKNSGRKSIK